jgi:hypothetical protein
VPSYIRGMSLEEHKKLEELKELLFEYLERMDRINPGPYNIFRTAQSKIDLETKVWHFFHKLEAATYHYERVIDISQQARQKLNSIPDLRNDKETRQAKIQFRLEYQDSRIRFEIDAFLAAARSALDFIASVISRYIRGTNFDRFRGVVKKLESSSDPIASVVQNAWVDWIEDLIDYRDYLIHRGVLSPTTSSHIEVSEPESSNAELQEIIEKLPLEQGKPIIFPMLLRPAPGTRLTRFEILGLDQEDSPYGVNKTVESVEISSDRGKIGKTVVRYELAPGFVEAGDFCKEYLEKLLDFCFVMFRSISNNEFTHIQY